MVLKERKQGKLHLLFPKAQCRDHFYFNVVLGPLHVNDTEENCSNLILTLYAEDTALQPEKNIYDNLLPDDIT